ncbi:MAG: hypothetical protein JNN32_04465 [Flavobacteriales bacterium]|nr:hypothetical protein [Flavobacteriales bacterium]
MALGEVIGEILVEIFVEGLFHGFIKRVLFPLLRLPGVLLAWLFDRLPVNTRVLASKGTPLSIMLSVLYFVGMGVMVVLVVR